MTGKVQRSHWDRTYQRTEISVGDFSSVAQVWSAITDNLNLHGSLCIRFRHGNGNSEANLYMTALQMRALASTLNSHADRLEELKHELDYLQTEAA